jgi:hypothetical protein
MKDAALLSSLEKIFHLESRSFVRYLVEASSSTSETDFDGKVAAFVEAWYRDTQGNLGTLQRLVEKEDFIPGSSTWPLVFAQYHFLAYGYLLGDIQSRMTTLFQAIETESASLGDWPAAQAAVKALLAAEKPHLDKVAKLISERPDDKSDDGPRRKVSANFW